MPVSDHKVIVIVFLLLGSVSAYSQKFVFKNRTVAYIGAGYIDNSFIHSPDSADNTLLDTGAYLIKSEPSPLNYETYFSVARALWKLSRIKEAKMMFLKIVGSKESFYENSYYNGSDLPNDHSQKLYSYGSYTSNYKNDACIYLTNIYIEERKFNAAFNCLEKAVKKYKVTYTCGTGISSQKNLYNDLYVLCYEGLGKDKEFLDLMLPRCFDWYVGSVVPAIKRTCSKQQIKDELKRSVETIRFSATRGTSSGITYINGVAQSKEPVEEEYYIANGTVKLFGKKIFLPSPQIEKGQLYTKRIFKRSCKSSSLYLELRKYVS